ncbi:MAG: hypothetical protein GYB68_05650, partial [Chloroflexi bacterium]|nr:hypothetical protein [Chloroflexota bacterium]
MSEQAHVVQAEEARINVQQDQARADETVFSDIAPAEKDPQRDGVACCSADLHRLIEVFGAAVAAQLR